MVEDIISNLSYKYNLKIDYHRSQSDSYNVVVVYYTYKDVIYYNTNLLTFDDIETDIIRILNIIYPNKLRMIKLNDIFA